MAVDIKTIVGRDAIKGLEKTNNELKQSNDLLKEQIQLLDTLNKEYGEIRTNVQLKGKLNKQEQANLKIQQEQNKILIGNKKLEQEAIKVHQQSLKVDQEREKKRQQSIKTKKLEATATKKQAQAQKTLINEYKEEIKTGKQATEQNKRLRNMRNNLDKTTKNYSKKLDKINKLIDRNNKLTGKQADKEKKRSLGIGKYKEALSDIEDKLDSMPGAQASVAQGFVGMAKQAAKFLANPIVAVIAAIVGAVTLLTKAFFNSKKGQEEYAAAIATTKAAWNSFSDALTSGKGLIHWAKNLGEVTNKAYALSKMIRKLGRDVIIAETGFVAMSREIEKTKINADDATLSFQKRAQSIILLAAQEEFFYKNKHELASKAYKTELVRLQTEYNGVKDLNKLKKILKTEDLQRLEELAAATINAEYDKTQSIEDNARRARDLRLDDFEQELDFLLDISDRRKTANEKIIADETLTTKTRQNLLNETKDLLNDSFDDQINLFEIENDLNIDRNKLLTLNNKESFEYARGLGMSERATNRLLEVIRDRISATSDLEEAQKGVNKAIRAERAEETSIDESVIEKKKEIGEQGLIINQEQLNIREEQLLKTLRFLEDEEQKSADTRKAIAQQLVSSLQEIGNVAFEFQQQKLNAELDAVRVNYDARIQAAEGDSKKQEALSRELAQKQWEIQVALAKSEKDQALTDIAINTAVATTKALPNIALAVLIAAAGVAQGILVQSQPLPVAPQFAEGGITPDTFIAGEEGQELMKLKDGSMMLTPNHATLYQGMKDTQVIPNAQTKQILGAVNLANSNVID
ncbi:MAG: hypothetical protein GY679_00110, partial [Mycoplasma sp.]|nr:hypothetical protein [Mycoplasma sp.]